MANMIRTLIRTPLEVRLRPHSGRQPTNGTKPGTLLLQNVAAPGVTTVPLTAGVDG